LVQKEIRLIMLKLNNVHEIGVIYKTSKFLSDTYHNNLFYRKVTYTGRENIEKGKPTLVGPNHQNALMDAMAVLASRRSNVPVFLARSDIFANDTVGNFLIGIKILPVYRIRDGKDKLAKNEEIFQLAVEVLEKNRTLVVFPEAEHTPYRSLLMLKKGLMRIAFDIAEKHNFDTELQIIPTGIYYDNYQNYRRRLMVNYGKPIYIKDYKDLYNENKQSALFALRNDMREAMIPLAIHIKNKNYYDFYENSREMFDYQVAKDLNLNLKNQINKFNVDKKVIEVLDNVHDNDIEQFKAFVEKSDIYAEELKKAKLKDYLFDKPVSVFKTFLAALLWLIMLPFGIFGFVNFAIPLGTPEFLVRKFKDKQFYSSVRYLVSFFLPTIWGLIGGALLWIFTEWWIGLAFFLIQYPIMGVWFEFRRLSKKLLGKMRYFVCAKNRKNLKQLKEDLNSSFDILYQNHKKLD